MSATDPLRPAPQGAATAADGDESVHACDTSDFSDTSDTRDTRDARDTGDTGDTGDTRHTRDTSAADEAAAVRERYGRRPAADPRYSLANPAALAAMQERQRAFVAALRAAGKSDFAALSLLEVGSGGGGNLLELIQLGFDPSRLSGIELLRERHAAAVARLPAAVRLECGDACVVPIAAERFDIVLQSTVFSSLLDDAYQARLALAMWRAVKPGGGVLWYDFTVDNPRNADVRGVPTARVRALFPAATTRFRRVTLAPPLARVVTAWHPGLYTLCNALPFLRTHVVGWLAKPR